MKTKSFKLLRFTWLVGLAILLSNNLAVAKPICAGALASSGELQETTRFHSPKDFIQNLFSGFKKNVMDGLIFEGPVLSVAQFKALARFSEVAGKPLQKGDVIRTIKFEELDQKYPSDIGDQTIQKNGTFEARLLDESKIDEKPREVLTFRIIYAGGKTVETPILVTGNVNSVNFDRGVDQLLDIIDGRFGGIQTIEIAHTHPTYVALVTSPNGTAKVRTNEISKGDLMASQSFAKEIPRGIAIVIKAIVPNGFNYSMGFARH